MTTKALILYKTIVDVIGRTEYQPGYPDWRGINDLKLPKKPGVQKGVTWCNQAAAEILRILGYDVRVITDKEGMGYTNASELFDNASKAAENPESGVYAIPGPIAQLLANQGIAILAAAREDPRPPATPSHVGIVAPDDNNYDNEAGPFIGQAGQVNGIRPEKQSFPGLSVPRYFIIPRKVNRPVWP